MPMDEPKEQMTQATPTYDQLLSSGRRRYIEARQAGVDFTDGVVLYGSNSPDLAYEDPEMLRAAATRLAREIGATWTADRNTQYEETEPDAGVLVTITDFGRLHGATLYWFEAYSDHKLVALHLEALAQPEPFPADATGEFGSNDNNSLLGRLSAWFLGR